ncbi:tetratricopeptide repeat protein [Paraburkholderia sp. BCC1884]|uniref:tetratricopeptide repeat protein n=1 Tax=Paraburkholderia sp. BCC1884 TaxID=2562668 RepID=UPI0021B47A9F|nr:hypothetical protein [Paraburkholderia sp. BCC1884]
MELLLSIGHFARVHRRFDEARYLFERMALLYPQRAFSYLGLGLVEIDRLNYRGASRWFGRALEAEPDSALALVWLGASQVLEGHYARGVRTLTTAATSDVPGASSMAAAFLQLPECAPYAGRVHAARVAASLSTIERLTIRGGY